MNERLLLGQFGTFDVENFGDLIYPVLFQRMMDQRDEKVEIRRFSLMGSESLQNSGYNTRPIQELFASRETQLHTLVIGGGDVLRTDWNLIASHYCSTQGQQKDKALRFALQQLFTRWFNRRVGTPGEFRARYMSYPAYGPFIINPAGFSNIKSVAYCSCGVPFTFDDTIKQGVVDAIEKATFVYVRDRQSRDTLIRAGVKREIHAAPDLVVALSDFFDAATEHERGRGILQKLGVDIHRRILCFQSNPQPPENTVELVKQIKAYQKRTKCEVVLLPLGWCHGDREYLKQLAQDSGGAFKYIELNSIFEIVAVLAACDLFLGTSLHGNIVAFSFGIPHVFGPIQVAKREGFLAAVDLPPELKLDSWAEVNQKLDLATCLGGGFFAARATTAKRRVHEVFNLLFRAITAPKREVRSDRQFVSG